MLTTEQIQSNKERYINIMKTINKDINVEEIVTYLEINGFFTAPASTQYHCAFEGGLCAHTLEVYDALVSLCIMTDNDENSDTIKIIALFHDIAKMSLYEESVINEKVYCDTGTNMDAKGRFNWCSRMGYKTRSVDTREVYGDKYFTAYLLISRFIPLSEEEMVILVNQYSAFDNAGFANKELSTLMGRYPKIALLHSADIISSYVTENKYGQDN